MVRSVLPLTSSAEVKSKQATSPKLPNNTQVLEHEENNCNRIEEHTNVPLMLPKLRPEASENKRMKRSEANAYKHTP